MISFLILKLLPKVSEIQTTIPGGTLKHEWVKGERLSGTTFLAELGLDVNVLGFKAEFD